MGPNDELQRGDRRTTTRRPTTATPDTCAEALPAASPSRAACRRALSSIEIELIWISIGLQRDAADCRYRAQFLAQQARALQQNIPLMPCTLEEPCAPRRHRGAVAASAAASTGDVLRGIFMVSLSCLISACGLVAMKASQDCEQDRPLFKRWRWMLGFGCMIGAVPCTVSALSLIPLSLAAPFSGLTIIFSLLLAATGVLTERELLSPTEVGCTVLVLCGVSMVALFGPQSSGEAPPDVVLERFESAEFAIFAAALTVPVLLWAPAVALPSLSTCRDAVDACGFGTPLSAFSAAACGARSASKPRATARRGRHGRRPARPRLRRGSGSSSRWCRCPSRTAARAPRRRGATRPRTSRSAASASPRRSSCGCSRRRSAAARSRRRCRCTSRLLIVLSVAAGGVFFREFESMSSRSVAGFAVGGVIAMAGVAVLSRGKDDDDDDASDVGAELSTPSEEELQTVAAEVAEEEAGDVVGSLDAAAKASRERAASSSRERAISRERALSRGRPRRHSMRDFLGASGSLVVPPAVGVVLPAIREGALQNRRRVTRRHSFSLSLLPELRAASSGDADDSGSELANLRARTRRAASMCVPQTPSMAMGTPPT